MSDTATEEEVTLEPLEKNDLKQIETGIRNAIRQPFTAPRLFVVFVRRLNALITLVLNLESRVMALEGGTATPTKAKTKGKSADNDI